MARRAKNSPPRLFSEALSSTRASKKDPLDSAGAETLLKAIYPTTTIQDFLLARVKRVALRTHLNQDVFAQGRLGLYYVPAAAGRFDRPIFGMNISLHR